MPPLSDRPRPTSTGSAWRRAPARARAAPIHPHAMYPGYARHGALRATACHSLWAPIQLPVRPCKAPRDLATAQHAARLRQALPHPAHALAPLVRAHRTERAHPASPATGALHHLVPLARSSCTLACPRNFLQCSRSVRHKAVPWAVLFCFLSIAPTQAVCPPSLGASPPPAQGDGTRGQHCA